MSEQPTGAKGLDAPEAVAEDENIFDDVDEGVDKKREDEKKAKTIADLTEKSEEPKVERVYQRWQFINFFKVVVVPGIRETVDGELRVVIPRVSLRPQAHKNGIIDLDDIKREDISCDVSLERLTKNRGWMILIVKKLVRMGINVLTDDHDKIIKMRETARDKLTKDLEAIDDYASDVDAAQEEKRKELLELLK